MATRVATLTIAEGESESAAVPVSSLGIEKFVGGTPAGAIVILKGSSNGPTGRYTLAWSGPLNKVGEFRGKWTHLKAFRGDGEGTAEIVVDVSAEPSPNVAGELDLDVDASVTTPSDEFTTIFSFDPETAGTYQFHAVLTGTATETGDVYVAHGGGAFKFLAGVASKVGSGDGWDRGYISDSGLSVYGMKLVGDGASILFQVKGGTDTEVAWRLRLSIGVPE